MNPSQSSCIPDSTQRCTEQGDAACNSDLTMRLEVAGSEEMLRDPEGNLSFFSLTDSGVQGGLRMDAAV